MKRLVVTGVVMVGVLLGGCTDITVDWGQWPKWDGHQLRLVGSGVLATETFDVHDFDAVTAWGAGTVIVERTGTERLIVTGDDNVLPYVKVEVVGGMLRLGPESNMALTLNEDLVYRLEVKELTRLGGSGAVAFEANLGDQSDLSVELSGAAAFAGEGRVDELDVHASGASRFRGLALESEQVAVSASGATALEVWAVDRLVGSASGMATVRYVGDPIVSVSVSGLATVGPY